MFKRWTCQPAKLDTITLQSLFVGNLSGVPEATAEEEALQREGVSRTNARRGDLP